MEEQELYEDSTVYTKNCFYFYFAAQPPRAVKPPTIDEIVNHQFYQLLEIVLYSYR